MSSVLTFHGEKVQGQVAINRKCCNAPFWFVANNYNYYIDSLQIYRWFKLELARFGLPPRITFYGPYFRCECLSARFLFLKDILPFVRYMSDELRYEEMIGIELGDIHMLKDIILDYVGTPLQSWIIDKINRYGSPLTYPYSGWFGEDALFPSIILDSIDVPAKYLVQLPPLRVRMHADNSVEIMVPVSIDLVVKGETMNFNLEKTHGDLRSSKGVVMRRKGLNANATYNGIVKAWLNIFYCTVVILKSELIRHSEYDVPIGWAPQGLEIYYPTIFLQ